LKRKHKLRNRDGIKKKRRGARLRAAFCVLSFLLQNILKKRILSRMNWKVRLSALLILALGGAVGYFVYTSEMDTESSFPLRYGLDLSGGSHIVYEADVNLLEQYEVGDAMESLRDVIERRVNLFGVSEPIVQTEKGSVFGADSARERLIVELPGVTDVDAAVEMIGQTPLLEFKLQKENAEEIWSAQQEVYMTLISEEGGEPSEEALALAAEEPYMPTDLTGRYLSRAQLAFDQTTGQPLVSLTFTDEGAQLFADLTRENVGKVLAIYLDGAPISEPVIQSEILGGEAQITGSMNAQEAKTLVGRLNSGALPVPIHLISTQTIGPSLGEAVRDAGITAGMIGLLIVAVFLILWYRLPGVVAVVSLALYIILMLAIFKLIPVTLTAAGIAGFILSIGMAVDGNVIIFERIKEELRRAHGGGDEEADLRAAMKEGFARAWTSIRDGNTTSIITAIILFWFGTSMVEGFALVFGIGVVLSMFSAITITRTLLLAIAPRMHRGVARFLFNTGFSVK
jgi:preprotein translocase subunit SecD